MRRILLSAILILLSFLKGSSQDLRNSKWYGGNTGYNFNTNQQINTPSGLDSSYGFYNSYASVCNTSGNPLIITDGNKLMISNGYDPLYLISNQLKAGLSNESFLQNTIIIPKPSNPSVYYIVTISGNNEGVGGGVGFAQGLFYSEVNVANGTIPNLNVSLRSPEGYIIDESYGNTSNAITSVVHTDGINYWLVASIDNGYGNTLLSYLVTENGIEQYPSMDYSIGFNYQATSLKISTASGSQPELRKIACAGYGGTFYGNFDTSTGAILSSNSDPYGQLDESRSVEFSPDGNILYTLSNSGQLRLVLFDYNSPFSTVIDQYTRTNNSNFRSLQLGVDGHIYISGYSYPMNFIDNTNETYYPNIYYNYNLGYNASAMPQLVPFNPCLPTIDPVFTEVPPICYGSTQNPLPTSSTNGISGYWSPEFNNTETTTYTFTPYEGECATSTTSMIVQVIPKITPTFNTITPICQGSTINPLPDTSTNGYTGYWSPGFNNQYTTTQYFYPNNQQCYNVVSKLLTVNPIITPIFDYIAPICSGSSLNPLPTTSNDGIIGAWSPALNNTATITYTFTPNLEQCAVPIALTITVNPMDTVFTGLNSSYCSTDAPVTLVPVKSGGVFSGPGICGDIFIPADAGSGTITISYGFEENNYSCNNIPFSAEAINGTNIYLGDDDVSSGLPIGFNFNFYGNMYDQFYISSNGFISFDSNVSNGSSNYIPNSDNVNNIIAMAWDDLYPPAGGSISYETIGDEPNRKLVVSFTDINRYGLYYSITGQIILYEATNQIEIHTANNPSASTGYYFTQTQGIENATGTSGKAVPNRNATSWSASYDAWQFTPSPVSNCPSTSQTITVNVAATPLFNTVAPICTGAALSALPTTSLNGIAGSWSPALNNTATTTYIFTPNAGECAVATVLTITVNPIITPAFNAVAPICSGGSLNSLPNTSINSIVGTWVPALNNQETTTYTFTPNPGQCAVSTTLTIAVNPNVVPVFNEVSSICTGSSLDPLPITSANDITGNWSPALNNTTTTSYTFTPTSGQCAVTTITTITVNPIITPVFNAVAASCAGSAIPDLPMTSNNGVIGTWSPAIDIWNSNYYTFTPNSGQGCVFTSDLFIEVKSLTPEFATVGPYVQGNQIDPLPTTSINGINGAWSPEINNIDTTIYTFTPTSGQGCDYTGTTMTIAIIDPLAKNPQNAVWAFGYNIALDFKSTTPVSSNIIPASTEFDAPFGCASVSDSCGELLFFTNGINVWRRTGSSFSKFEEILYGDSQNTQNVVIIPKPFHTDHYYIVTSRDNNELYYSEIDMSADNGNGAFVVLNGYINYPYANTNLKTSLTSTFRIDGGHQYWLLANVNTGYSTETFSYFVSEDGILLNDHFYLPFTWNDINISSSIKISPDGSKVAIAGYKSLILGTFDTAWGDISFINSIDLWGNDILGFEFSPDSNILYYTSNQGLHSSNLNTYEDRFLMQGNLRSLQLGPNGKIYVTKSDSSELLEIIKPTNFYNPEFTTINLYGYTQGSLPQLVPVQESSFIRTLTLIKPNFNPIAPICYGSTTNPLPSVSTDGIIGSWSPAFNSYEATTYTFTPNGGQCALKTTLRVTVNPIITPHFLSMPSICQGTLIEFPSSSLEGISGLWQEDTENENTYIFTASEGYCAENVSMEVVVNESVVPTFNPVAAICAGETLENLPTTSINGITGSWSPEIDNTITTTYTFNPSEGQCAEVTTLTITVNPNIPVFNSVVAICPGTVLTALPTTSTNGYTGVWSPELNDLETTTYTFLPDEGQCASSGSLTIDVRSTEPIFDNIVPLCGGTPLNVLPIVSENGISGTWSTNSTDPNNVIYQFIPAEGSCEATTTFTITAIPTVVPTFDEVASIQSGDELDALPTVSLEGILGSWSPELNNTETTAYTFSPIEGQCSSNSTLTIEVIEANMFLATPSLMTINPEGFESSPQASTAPTGNSSEVGVTAGELSVSLTGGANYTIPIAVPPGINGVVPQIFLSYNSQGGNGLAGYGWNIGGISTISRIPATKYHVGIIDPVDFDSLDLFALDGQRLLVKNGTTGNYGGSATVYQTENFSNVKVTSYGTHPNGIKYGPAYFVVEYPDGSKAYYGNSNNSRSIMEWSITYWENPQGIRISYDYTPLDNTLFINSVNYGTRNSATSINNIQFQYVKRKRPEQVYVDGQSLIQQLILDKINVTGNGVGYRNYRLNYGKQGNSLGYETLLSITEYNGDSSKNYNPTVFTYDGSTNTTVFGIQTQSVLNLKGINNQNSVAVTGDFDNDGNTDLILYPTTGTNAKKEYWFTTKINTNTNICTKQNEGTFEEIFPISWLSGDSTSGYKMMQREGWCIVKSNEATNTTTFSNNYKDSSRSISSTYSKTYQFQRHTATYSYSCLFNNHSVTVNKNIPKTYVSGDFNGDGLTDAVAIENTFFYTRKQGCFDSYSHTVDGGKTYFINLDKRLGSNFVNEAGKLAISRWSKFIVADFNGDGKSDIYVFDMKRVTVYSLNSLNQFELLGKISSDSVIDTTKPLLMGDYNGDGKTDFVIPVSENTDNWRFYYATGIGFMKKTTRIGAAYLKTYLSNDNTIYNEVSYVPSDFNGDGKTDILVQENATIKSSGKYYTTKFSLFENASFSRVNSPIFQKANNIAHLPEINRNPISVVLRNGDPNRNLEYNLISDNKIFNFRNPKDNRAETLLKTITLGNGVRETITYSPLIPSNDVDAVYHDNNYTENYPYFDIVVAPDFKVVSKLERRSSTVYKKQLFGYYGAVSNVEGLGFLGFRSVSKTNWHDDNHAIITNISKFDISKRGANYENYTVANKIFPSYDFSTTSFIEKSVLGYESSLLSNKVFKLKNTTIEKLNGLEGTSSESVIVYDEYNNPTNSTVLLKNNGNTEQTNITDIIYESPTDSPTYVIGRPHSKTQTISVTGDVRANEEIYGYTNNLLTQIKKRGNSVGIYITEDNLYDDFGNITQKTITVPSNGYEAAPAPRVTKYEYDLSGRFLKKSTDIEELETLYDYNYNDGRLNSVTNPYDITTLYLYDSWLRKIKTTDYLDKNNVYTYAVDGTGSTIVTTGDDQSYSVVYLDDLGRKTKSGFKNVNGNYIYVDSQYDIYDRNYKTSEPYSGSGASQWNVTEYDIYNRVIKNISYTGKTIITEYNGLITKVNDSIKIKEATKNAMGNVVRMKDTPGGTIQYTYYADGNLNTTNYDGIETTIYQDGWGRKTMLIDPSAGNFSYRYNLFGEITLETTPNGSTAYILDNYGKLLEKNVVFTGSLGSSTYPPNPNTKTIYAYDPSSKLLINSNMKNTAGVLIGNFDYVYDIYKRLQKTTETTPYAEFIKEITFDGFGRLDTEKSKATAYGQSSEKTTRNEYHNGFLWKISDAVTQASLWEINAINERNQVTAAFLGNGINIANKYDQYGFPTEFKHVKTGVTPAVMILGTNFNSLTGNLINRTNSHFNWNEYFTYDSSDRLNTYADTQGARNQNYDHRGRITSNNLGTYNYTNTDKPYQQTELDSSNEGYAYYANRAGIFSDSMENNQGWGDPTFMSGVEELVKVPANYDATKSKTGNKSLKIANNTGNPTVIVADKWIPIDNPVETQYMYSAWVYSDTPDFTVSLLMKTDAAQGYYSDIDNTFFITESTTINKWVYVQKLVTVPASIKKLKFLLQSSCAGNVWFDDLKIVKMTDGLGQGNREQNITYDGFKNPLEIYEKDVDHISFIYNDAHSRSDMFYGGTGDDKMQRQYRKHYSADGSMEVKYNTNTQSVEFITYLGGDAYSAPVVVKSNGITQNYLYLHRDYQGSILAITNEAGAVVEKRLFDAWGNIIKVQDGAGNSLNGFTILDRGYTGHEHLQSVGLINMNARLYDPLLHRFLQPDNYVQDPFNTQNYNRYGYCWNNPTKFTDPSGEFIWFVPLIYAAVNVGVDLAMNNGKMNFGQIAMSAAQGALSGCLGGATSVGGAFLGAGIGQLNKFMPAIPIYQSGNFSIGISPMIGFGTSGFNVGASLNVNGQTGDFAYSASVGVGFNSGVSSLGEAVGGSGYWNAGGFLGYNDGHANYGLGYSYNSFGGNSGQGVGAITIQAGDFGFRLDEDAFIGDNGDRFRTGGMLMTYKVSNDLTLAFGASMMTGEAFDEYDVPGGNPNVKSGFGMHNDTKLGNLRAGAMYGGFIYKGQATFYGHNSEKRLHTVQNAIHRSWPIYDTPYFPDRGLTSKPYTYSGSYHSSYLYY